MSKHNQSIGGSMIHLDEEQIAALAEGNISGREHEECLAHLAQCQECFRAYSATLQFLEAEKDRRSWKEKIKLALRGFKQIIRDIRLPLPDLGPVPARLYVPSLAVVLVFVLLILPFIQRELRERATYREQVHYAAVMVWEIENRGSYAFSSDHNKINAAVRVGILLEDLFLIAGNKASEKLQTTLVNMLNTQLKEFEQREKQKSFCILQDSKAGEPVLLDGTLQCVEQELYQISPSLLAFFRFGRFLERSSLNTFSGKLPPPHDIDNYFSLARAYDLPQGINRGLTRLKDIIIHTGENGSTGDTVILEEYRRICTTIKNIFFSPGD